MHRDKNAEKKVNGPRGHEYVRAERARPVELYGAPKIVSEVGPELLLIVKQDRLFVCSLPNGDILPGSVSGEGLYADDTRYLSRLQLQVAGREPLLLSYSAGNAYRAVVNLTNPPLQSAGDEHVAVEEMTLSITRTRLIQDRMYETISVTNYGKESVDTDISVILAADFADMFEIRGYAKRDLRGESLVPLVEDDSIRFAYIGEDQDFRETIVDFDHPLPRLTRREGSVTASWGISLEPRGSSEVAFTVEPSFAGRVEPLRTRAAAAELARSGADAWRAESTHLHGAHSWFNSVLESSARDLRALLTRVNGGRITAAGIPWYVAPFGRDALITSYQTMLLNPDSARDALTFLAGYQSSSVDPLRDSEPGKIPHELRFGELSRAGHIPHSPYYGSVDATPLFLMVASAYYRWTADLDMLIYLRPALDAALEWIGEHGDPDRDGFVEYQRRSPAGLDNHGWKDSSDCVVHSDGSLAEGPIALAEVQGYSYIAQLRIAEVYKALGEDEKASSLRKEADRLRVAFNDAFWMPDEGTFCLALDGNKQQVVSVTSNPGHALFCGIVDDDKAAVMAERLMADDMFSGWGIRTLSSQSPAYNPMSYHNGSVWPHDNAIVAAGLKRYNVPVAVEKIAEALFTVARHSTDNRLPELLCGFKRDESGAPFVRYPVACRPQAWAAAAPFMILQAMLGISADAPQGRLTVHDPELPAWLPHVEVTNLRVGNARVDLAFTGIGVDTTCSALRVDGDIEVILPR